MVVLESSAHTTSPKQQPLSSSVHCEMLVLQFFYGAEHLHFLRNLEKELETLLTNSGSGEYLGCEISDDFGEGYMLMVGESSEQLFRLLKPTLENCFFMDKSVATLRTGPFTNPLAKETDYTIRFCKLNQN